LTSSQQQNPRRFWLDWRGKGLHIIHSFLTSDELNQMQKQKQKAGY